jgi:hypothetical protein
VDKCYRSLEIAAFLIIFSTHVVMVEAFFWWENISRVNKSMEKNFQNTINNLSRSGLDQLEGEDDLVGFYDLLLKIDKRTNPQSYTKNPP